MEQTSTMTIVTAIEKDADEVKTVLTIDWTGMTPEMYRALATPTLVIKRQGEYRRGKKIPSADTIVAKDNLPGSRHGMTLEQAASSMNLEQKKAFAAQLAAMIAKETPAEPEAPKMAKKA